MYVGILRDEDNVWRHCETHTKDENEDEERDEEEKC